MRSGLHFSNGLLCDERSILYAKIKGLKWSQNLNWSIECPPPKIHHKYLRRGSFTEYKPWKELHRARLRFTLKKVKNLNELFLDCSFREDGGLNETFSMLTRLRRLTSLEIKESMMDRNMEDKTILWIHRVFKLFPKLKAFTIFHLNSAMEKDLIRRTFEIFRKMSNLVRVHLGIQLDSRFIQIMLPTLKLLLSANSKISLQLTLFFSDACFAEDFTKLFHELKNLRQLKELTVEFDILLGEIPCREFIQFFETNPQLEVFWFRGQIEKELPLALPLSKLPHLRRLAFDCGESAGLRQENFTMLTESLAECKNLRELSLDFSLCPKINDKCISSLQTAFTGLTSLQILDLKFGRDLEKNYFLSSAAVDSLSQIIPLLKGLARFSFSILKCILVQDKSVQFLLESISQLTTLKNLVLNFSQTKLTDEAFTGLAPAVERLPEIDRFDFVFDFSEKIQGQFLRPLADLIIEKKERFKKCSLMHISFAGTCINSEELQKFRLEIQKMLYPGKTFVVCSTILCPIGNTMHY